MKALCLQNSPEGNVCLTLDPSVLMGVGQTDGDGKMTGCRRGAEDFKKSKKKRPPICPKTCQVFEGLLMRFPFLFPPAQTDRSWDASGLCGRARGFSTVCCVSPLTGLIRTTATDSHGHSRGGEGRCCRRQAKTRPPTSHHFLICLLTWPAITAVLHASM